MTIRRSPSPLRKNFTILPNTTLNDTRLSWEARGLLAHLLSKPDHWKVIVKALVKESPAGRDAIYTILKELEKHGYITNEQTHEKDGTFGETERVVHEVSCISPDGTAYGLAGYGSAGYGPTGYGEPVCIVRTDLEKELTRENTELTLSSQQSSDSEKGSKVFEASPYKNDAIRLSHLLHALISENGIKAKPITVNGWYEQMELLMRIDEKSPAEVEAVLRWSQKDAFWHSNILSPRKFREKYETLIVKSRQQGAASKPKGFGAISDFLKGGN